jgi:hypothetical protein
MALPSMEIRGVACAPVAWRWPMPRALAPGCIVSVGELRQNLARSRLVQAAEKLLRPQRRDSLQGSSHRQPCGPIPVGAVMLITRVVDALSCLDRDGPGRVRAKRTEQSSVCLSHGVDLARLWRAQRVRQIGFSIRTRRRSRRCRENGWGGRWRALFAREVFGFACGALLGAIGGEEGGQRLGRWRFRNLRA